MRNQVIKVRIDEATKEALKKRATKENRTMSNMIRIAIEKFLKGK